MSRVALAIVPLLLAAGGAAHAADYHAMGGADLMLSSAPGSGVSDVELGLSLRASARNLGRFDLKLDFTGREGFVGNSSLNQLWELNATAHAIRGKLDVTFGRLRTPGGFWLIADGLMIDAHYTAWLGQSFYGGLRSFTTGLRPTWMTSDRPIAMPLAGTSLWARHRIVQASLTFTWAKDAIELPGGPVSATQTNVTERHVEQEYFLDGQVTIYAHEKVFLSGGATFGTRYDVQFNATNPYGPTNLGVATLGSFGAYGLVEYRPIKRLRLTYTFNYEQVRLIQSQLLAVKADGTQAQAADGTFQDHVLRATGLVWKALRAELSYRLRLRENTDIEHRLTVGLRGDDLWRGLGAFASVGVDVDQGLTIASSDPTLRKIHDRVLYSGGLSYLRSFLDLRLGILYTDGIGSGLTFSTHTMSQNGAHPTELFPYVLETNRVAFVRVFASFWKMYAGLDVEENLDSVQLRMLAQLGAVL